MLTIISDFFSAEGRKVEEISVEKLYEISMTNKIIISMSLPSLDENKYRLQVVQGIILRN